MSAHFALADLEHGHTWFSARRHARMDRTRLALTLSDDGVMRGTLHRPGRFHLHLPLEGGELGKIPEILTETWTQTIQEAIVQLRRRAAGRPHSRPDGYGQFQTSLGHRVKISDGQTLSRRLDPSVQFEANLAVIGVSAGQFSEPGSVSLFGPDVRDSTELYFHTDAGQVDFNDGVRVDRRVPQWLHLPVCRAAQEVWDRHRRAEDLLHL